METKSPQAPRPFVAYYRVSTQRQGRSGLGIEAQRAAVGRFAEAENLTLIAEFIEVETGKGSDALERRAAGGRPCRGPIGQTKGLGCAIEVPVAERRKTPSAQMLTAPFANVISTVGTIRVRGSPRRRELSRH